jgi:hypothetical protein
MHSAGLEASSGFPLMARSGHHDLVEQVDLSERASKSRLYPMGEIDCIPPILPGELTRRSPQVRRKVGPENTTAQSLGQPSPPSRAASIGLSRLESGHPIQRRTVGRGTLVPEWQRQLAVLTSAQPQCRAPASDPKRTVVAAPT